MGISKQSNKDKKQPLMSPQEELKWHLLTKTLTEKLAITTARANVLIGLLPSVYGHLNRFDSVEKQQNEIKKKTDFYINKNIESLKVVGKENVNTISNLIKGGASSQDPSFRPSNPELLNYEALEKKKKGLDAYNPENLPKHQFGTKDLVDLGINAGIGYGLYSLGPAGFTIGTTIAVAKLPHPDKEKYKQKHEKWDELVEYEDLNSPILEKYERDILKGYFARNRNALSHPKMIERLRKRIGYGTETYDRDYGPLNKKTIEKTDDSANKLKEKARTVEIQKTEETKKTIETITDSQQCLAVFNERIAEFNARLLKAEEDSYLDYGQSTDGLYADMSDAVDDTYLDYGNTTDGLYADKSDAVDDTYLDYGSAKDGLEEIATKGESTAEALDNAFKGWTDNFSWSLDDILHDADGTFKDIAKSFGTMVGEVILQKEVLEPFKDWLGGFFRQKDGTGSGGWASTALNWATSLFFHEGGIVGYGEGRSGVVSPLVFAGAPRFHKGLMPDEFPAILQKGEGVFTPGQMKALGSQGTGLVVNNNITINSSENKEKDQNLAEAISKQISQKVKEVLLSEKRCGGMLNNSINRSYV